MQDRPLTTKQHTFAQGILQGLSGVQAAMKAGYSGNDNVLAQRAHELVRHSKVKAIIDKRRAELEVKTEIDAKLCTQRFDKLYAYCVCVGDTVGAARAIENHAKHIGYYEADNNQSKAVIAIALRNEQAQIDKQIATARALDSVPDALAT